MSKQAALTDTKPPQQKPTTIPAALTHDQGPPKIETKPIPPTNPTPKPTPPKEQYKPIPQETKIILDTLQDLEGILYSARQRILQQYGPVDYNYITDIELKFTEQQTKQLSFEQQGNLWIIRPKYHLEKQDFTDIAQTVRNLGGEYISAGKDSHFRVKQQ
jgi:hypothetical protein